MKCPICEGEGGWVEVIDYWIGGPYSGCNTCDGDGDVSLWTLLSIWFWEHVPIRFLEWYSDWRYPCV